MEDDIVPAIKDRMGLLDNYRNSKELNELQSLIGDIEAGRSAQKQAARFLNLVPVGSYDSDRRKYKGIVLGLPTPT